MSDFWRQPNADDGDSGDEADDDGVSSLSGRRGTIYMIDAAIAASVEHLDACLAIIERSIMNGLIQSSRNLVGVCVYNTEHSPEPGASALGGAAPDGAFGAASGAAAPASTSNNDAAAAAATAAAGGAIGRHVVPPATAIVWPMQVHSRAAVQFFKHWRSSADQHDFRARYGCAVHGRHLSEALWLCSRMLTGCDYKLRNAGIVLFTNEPEPMREAPDCGAADVQRVFQRARDLLALNVDLEVVPLVDAFDARPFYRRLICTVENADEESFRMPEPAEQRENLCMRLFQRDYRFACLRYLTLRLGAEEEEGAGGATMGIGCAMYGMTRSVRGPQSVRMVAASNEVVQSRVCYVRAERLETADDEEPPGERILLPGELTKYMETGGQRIQFSTEEVASMRGIMEPGLRLLGFKPLAELPARSFVKPSRLLYPAERQVRGSTAVFRALWQRCRERRVFAVCVLAQVRKVAPRYVALVPQEEAADGADGFRIVYLPMQTDVRELDVFAEARPVPAVPAGGLELMRKAIQKLTIKYEARMFEDPHMQEVYANLEALVYDEPKVEVEDQTVPDVGLQDGRLAGIVDGVEEVFGADGVAAASSKRKADDGAEAGGSSAKVPRTVSQEDVSAAILSGAATKLTVAQLREYAQAKGITAGVQKLKKAELIDLLREMI